MECLFVVGTAVQAQMFAEVEQRLRERGKAASLFLSLDPIKRAGATEALLRHGIAQESIVEIEGWSRGRPHSESGWLTKLAATIAARRGARALLNCESGGAIRVAIFGNDLSWVERTVIAQVKRAGIRSVLIQDGVLGPESTKPIIDRLKWAVGIPLAAAGVISSATPGYGLGKCDRICVYGDATRRMLVNMGVPAASVLTTGQPRYRGLEQPPVSRIRRARGELGLTVDEPFILFASQPLVEDHQIKSARYAAVLDRVAELTRGVGMPVVIKVHPREAQEKFETIKRWPHVRIARMDSDLPALIAGARMTTVITSTVGLESLILGVPVLVLRLRGIPRHIPYGPGAGAIEIWPEEASESEFRESVIRAMHEWKSPQTRQRAREFVSDQVLMGDAVGRVVGVLESLRTMVLGRDAVNRATVVRKRGRTI